MGVSCESILEHIIMSQKDPQEQIQFIWKYQLKILHCLDGLKFWMVLFLMLVFLMKKRCKIIIILCLKMMAFQ